MSVHSVAQEGSAVPGQTEAAFRAVCMNKGGEIDPWAAGCLVPGCTSEVGVACRNPNKDARA